MITFRDTFQRLAAARKNFCMIMRGTFAVRRWPARRADIRAKRKMAAGVAKRIIHDLPRQIKPPRSRAIPPAEQKLHAACGSRTDLAQRSHTGYNQPMNRKIRFTQAGFERLFPGVRIERPQREHLKAAQAHLDNLTKPRGSLGRLEELARRLYAMRRGELPLSVSPALMLTVAGDHGVAAQGVSPFPQAVTRQMVMNFLRGGAAVNVLCRCAGMDLRVVDAGCAGGPFAPHPMLLDRRLGDGTADMSRGPAMSREACLSGLRRGMELAAEAAGRGYRCLATGEMGIANSTAGTALYCALLGLEPDSVTGPGAGSDPVMVRHKAGIVREALRVNAPLLSSGDPVDILAAVGGFEIAMMSGVMLGAAARRLPVLVDGFICGAAYAAALAICPALADYAVLSHASAEPGHSPALARLPHAETAPERGGEPLLRLGMRLGEGTGGALAYHLLRCAAAIYNDMATFDAAGVTATEADRIA